MENKYIYKKQFKKMLLQEQKYLNKINEAQSLLFIYDDEIDELKRQIKELKK